MVLEGNKSLISVIMINYNAGRYIGKAIESILKQTYKNFEFIIVDDCSTDKSWEIIKEYSKKDRRIKPFRNKKNLKIVKTRNKAFSKISKNSSYVAILDSDDISYNDRLEKQVLFLESNPNYSIVGSNIVIIDEKSKILGKRNYDLTYEKIKDRIYVKTILAHSSVMIRVRDLKKAGMFYINNYDVCEDWELYFRLFKYGKIANINKPLIKYRISTTQSKNKKLKRFLINGIKIKKKYAKNNNYFSLKYAIRQYQELFLYYFVPSSLILYLFKKLEYKK